MMKTILFTLLTLSFTIAQSQTYLNSEKDLEKHANLVMSYMSELEFTKAFTELEKHWPLPQNELSQLESQTLKQFNLVGDRFGAVIGFDFVQEKTINDFAIKKTYVVRFEKHLLRVMFTYYKNDQGWMLNSFKWDDSFSELFE